MRYFLLFLLWSVIGSRSSLAQVDSTNIPNSENGWYLSPHGTIRVLVLFAEIEHDKNPGKNPANDAAEHWPKGQLPTWKDNLFDPLPSAQPTAMISRYFHDVSLGNYTVLGDYVDRIFTLKESEYAEVGSAHAIGSVTVKEANKRMDSLITKHGLRITDFDLWQDGGKAGLPKVNKPDSPHKYDHVMVIARNSGLTHGQGSTDQGSPGRLWGYESDTQSRFGGMNALPFEILKHEYNHLLLGGNNFHSGGGNAAQFESYFIPLLGGWSMMGAASSSLLTCSGWDRDRLGWTAPGAPFRVNAINELGAWINGDLDPVAGDTGTFMLRDFVTTGDAIRIRMPYLSENEFPQWLWLENHLGRELNGSPTDKFHYQDEMSCVQGIEPGVFAMLQVDREKKRGTDIFGGQADYLRALPAGGQYDLLPHGDTVRYECLWSGRTVPLIVDDRWANPLTGGNELEIPLYDRNNDGILDRRKEGLMMRIDVRKGVEKEAHRFFGHRDQAFTFAGNDRMGMGTNPSLTNVLTLVGSPSKDKFKMSVPNNRVVHLAGLSVRIEEQRKDGVVRLRVLNNDTRINRDTRYCADSIVLHAVSGYSGYSLYLEPHRVLTIDRSLTATRIDRPEVQNGTRYFSASTRLTVLCDARVMLAGRSQLVLVNNSEVHLLPGSSLELDPSAVLAVESGSRIVVHGDAMLKAKRKQLRKLERKRRIVRLP